MYIFLNFQIMKLKFGFVVCIYIHFGLEQTEMATAKFCISAEKGLTDSESSRKSNVPYENILFFSFAFKFIMFFFLLFSSLYCVMLCLFSFYYYIQENNQ
jgi:hypothetical protein